MVIVKGVAFVFFAIGPLQPVIAVDDACVPSLLYITKVPQKAKEVLWEPVLLLIDNINVLVIVVPAVHVPHASSPGLGGSTALTNDKSPDVHDVFGSGTCENDFVEIPMKRRRTIVLKQLANVLSQLILMAIVLGRYLIR